MDKYYKSRLEAIDKLVELLQQQEIEIDHEHEVVHLGDADAEIKFFDDARKIIHASSDYVNRLGRITEDTLFSDYYLAAVDKYIDISTTPALEKSLELRKSLEDEISQYITACTGIDVEKDSLDAIEFTFTDSITEKQIKTDLRDIISNSEYFYLHAGKEGRQEVFQHFYKMAKVNMWEQKMANMEHVANIKYVTLEHDQLRCVGIDNDASRMYIETNGVPSAEIKNMLKSAGMRWSPSNVRWQSSTTEQSVLKLQELVLKPLGFERSLEMIDVKVPVMTAEQDTQIENEIVNELQESLTKIDLQRTIYENENTKLLNLMKNTNWSGMEKQIESQQTIVSQELRRLMNLTSTHAREFVNVEINQPNKDIKVFSEQSHNPNSTLASTLSGKSKDVNMQDVFDELKQGVKNAFDNPVEFKAILDFASTSQNYSLNNILLLQSQIDKDIFMSGNPIITNTYNGWQKQDITVNKGEKALKIIVPGTFKAFKNEQGIIKAVNKATEHEKQLIDSGKIDVFENNYFRLKAEVFLYTQTDADISKLFADRIVEHPDAGKLYEQIKEQTQALGIQVLERNIGMPAGKAVEHGNSKLIIINDQLNDSHKLKTLIHEIAHIETHFDNNEASINTKELEAEASAYLTCKELGIDTSDYSFNYLASWSKDKEVKELTQAFSSIKKITLNIKEKYILKNESINNAHVFIEHDTGFKQTAIKDASQHMSIDM